MCRIRRTWAHAPRHAECRTARIRRRVVTALDTNVVVRLLADDDPGSLSPCHHRHRPFQQLVPPRGDAFNGPRRGHRGLDSHAMVLGSVVLQDPDSGPGDVVAAR